jgi:uncharacterized tellurite resistance protein B-like protein
MISIRKQLNILIQLAQADKHFAKSERDMIFHIAKQWNFSDEEITELIRHPEPIETLSAVLTNDQKFEYLQACIALIHIDHKLFQSELIFCKSIAIKLGFKKSSVDFFVDNFDKMPLEAIKSKILAEYLMPNAQ